MGPCLNGLKLPLLRLCESSAVLLLLPAFSQHFHVQPTMTVSRTFGRKEHLYPHDNHDTDHGDETRHGRVDFVPESRETWIRQVRVCSR